MFAKFSTGATGINTGMLSFYSMVQLYDYSVNPGLLAKGYHHIV